MSRTTTPSQTHCRRQQPSRGRRKCRSVARPYFKSLFGLPLMKKSRTGIVSRRPVHLQESTSFFTRKKTMSVPPKKITGIIDGMKHVYFSKVTTGNVSLARWCQAVPTQVHLKLC